MEAYEWQNVRSLSCFHDTGERVQTARKKSHKSLKPGQIKKFKLLNQPAAPSANPLKKSCRKPLQSSEQTIHASAVRNASMNATTRNRCYPPGCPNSCY